jgi:hypothetical protein
MTTNTRIQTFIDIERAAKEVAIANSGEIINDSEFFEQASRVFYYTGAVAKAERQVSVLKLQLEMAEAKALTTIRSDALKAGEKVPTEAALKALVRQDKTVTRLDIDLLDAQEVLSTIKGVVEALRHKKDMLVMRGHMSRDERKARQAIEGDLQDGTHDHVRERQARVRQGLASQKEE